MRSVLERAIAFIEDLHLAEVRDADIEIITLPYETDRADDGDAVWGGENWGEGGDLED